MSRDWISYQPSAELLAESVRVTRRMQRLAMPTATRTTVKQMHSPGRLITRNAVTAAALRSRGNHEAAMKVPLFRTRHIDRANRPPGVVGIMADISGSMKWSTTGVGEAAWLLARGAAHAGARVASVAFGTGVDPIVFPGEVPQTVLVRSANDYDHNPDRALTALDGALGLSIATSGGVPTSRVVVILSDLQWGHERRPFTARARALMASGVRFVVLGTLTGYGGQGGQIGMDRIDSEITRQLGLHVPIDPRALSPDSAAHKSLPRDVQRAVLKRGLDAFQTIEPTPLTASEIHMAHAAGVKKLLPMTVIPRALLGRENYSHRHGMDPVEVRTGIIEHTLRVLEGME